MNEEEFYKLQANLIAKIWPTYRVYNGYQICIHYGNNKNLTGHYIVDSLYQPKAKPLWILLKELDNG